MARSSVKVGMKAAQTLYYAEEQADRIGLPLKLSITINFSLMSTPPGEAVAAFSILRNQRFAGWIRRPTKGAKGWATDPTWTYGFENSLDGQSFDDPEGPHNVHVHWSVHVPEPRIYDFKGRLHDWITEIAGSNDWPENALSIKRITSHGSTRYLLKGAMRVHAQHFGVKPDDVKAQGFIMGARTGTTLNIGPKARRGVDKKLGINRKRTLY
jgi:hypothetical protein